MNQQEHSFDREDFLRRIAVALDLMGFDTELVSMEEYPISIEMKLLGYEDLPVDAVLIFADVEQIYGGEIELLQVYFSLYQDDLEPEQFERLELLCNQINMNTAIGCYGVQEEISRICYKQAVPIRHERDLETSLQSVMDVIILMALSMDQHYDSILKTILG